MRTIETIRTELNAPDFKNIATWKIPSARGSADIRIAAEESAKAARENLWGAFCRGTSMSVTAAEASELIRAGARKTDREPGRV